jgi:hypothetical protein
MGVVECKLCEQSGVTCQDFRTLPFFIKSRAVFVRDVHIFTRPPIAKCEAKVDPTKIPEVARGFVYGAGEIPEMYIEDYDRG